MEPSSPEVVVKQNYHEIMIQRWLQKSKNTLDKIDYADAQDFLVPFEQAKLN